MQECLLSDEVYVHLSGYIMELIGRLHISRDSNSSLNEQKIWKI